MAIMQMIAFFLETRDIYNITECFVIAHEQEQRSW